MRILSLDLGSKSLGVCISDPMNFIPIPLENFMFEREDWEAALQRVVELTEEYKIGTILLGHPLRTDGKKSEMTLIAESFYESLKEKIDAKIELFDERFSTKRGLELLKKKYSDKKILEQYKDMAAAYVMLSDYLLYNK